MGLTSEQLCDISRQPADTCPLIDAVIAKLSKIERHLDLPRRRHNSEDADYIEELEEIINSAQSDLSDFTGKHGELEPIRERVMEIRSWGQEWKELAKAYAPPAHEDYQI